MYSARIVLSRWQQVDLRVHVRGRAHASPCMRVCLLTTMRVACTPTCVRSPEGGGGEERERKVGGLVRLCVYESPLCEIKHANGGLF